MYKKTTTLSVIMFLLGVVVSSLYWRGHVSSEQNTLDKPDNKPITLGWISALSGGATTFGVPAYNAGQLAVDEINKNGGIRGRKLELLVEDGKCNAKEASLAANSLIQTHNVPVVFTNCSTETLTTAAVAEPRQVIVMGAVTTSRKVTDAGDFVFRVSPTDTKSTFALAQYALDQGYRQTAIMVAQDPFGLAILEDFEKYYTDNGGTIVLTEKFMPDQTDFRTELTKIKNSSAESFLFVPIKPQNSINFLQQKEELQLNIPMLTHKTVVNPEILEAVAPLLEGAVYTDIKFDESREEVQDFLKRYREVYGEDPTFATQLVAGAYDGVMLIADAIKSCSDEYDTTCIRDYLYSVKDYPGISGTITLDKNGDPDMDFELRAVRDGKTVTIVY